MADLTWNVYVEDFNHKCITSYNIFNHYSFNNYVKEAYTKYNNDFEQFAGEVKRELSYYFWSKCEWEIIISNWPPSKDFNNEKISVYDQVKLNWDIFIDYVWKTLKENDEE